MNPIRWKNSKWLPRFLAVPVPEPAQQASRILSIQINIMMPTRLVVMLMVGYYLFFGHSEVEFSTTWPVVRQTMEKFFVFYFFLVSAAFALLIFKRFPPRWVQWVVFIVGLVDGVLVSGLTLETGGFGSTLYWVFPGLIVVNALSIPLATPQIVVNLALSGLYLGAGLLFIIVSENDNAFLQTNPLPHRIGLARFAPSDIGNLPALAAKLRQTDPPDGIFPFLGKNLSPESRRLLDGYNGGSNLLLQQDLAEDFNRISTNAPLYNKRRFATVTLSPDTLHLLTNAQETADFTRMNHRLLQDIFSAELRRRKNLAAEEMQSSLQPFAEGYSQESATEPFILRLIILWLMTASCYGVQLLLFRQRVSEEEERKSSARNDELKAAGRLAAEIAHQLKNPLAIINNAVFSVQRGLDEGKTDHTLQLSIIREEIERSDRILTQLMGYAQLSEGRVEKLDVAEDIERALAEVFPPASDFETVLIRDFSPRLPQLLMQRNHLSVVLVNLFQNAREAMSGRGTLRVSAHYGDAGTLQIVVQDSGPGIPAEKLDKIFEAYYTTKERGTGLGLAIVRHNIEIYGGAVRIESELGKGARFILLFPSKTFIVTES